MFTTGEKTFALIFIIAFVVIIGYQFYKDSRRNKTLFKGTYWVIIALVSLMIGYILLNKFMN
jgi:predicted negative regulator of RcsB-dependent stress response